MGEIINKKDKSKTQCCFEILQMLNTGRRYSKQELAERIDSNCNPRNIREYINELRIIGYDIKSYSGVNGGYELEKSSLIPVPELKQQDVDSLMDAFNYVLSQEDFINKNGFIESMGIICSSIIIESERTPRLISSNKTSSGVSREQIGKWYKLIYSAIQKKVKVKLVYDWLKQDKEELIVHPYELFLCDNEWRFIAWVESADKNPIPLKLSRIISLEETNKTFTIHRDYKLSNIVKDGILLQNGEMFPITLIASGVRAKLFKEKVYGKNQTCEDLPDGRTKVTLDMQNNYSTYNFILGCGELVEVIEPKWLRDKIKELANNIIKNNK